MTSPSISASNGSPEPLIQAEEVSKRYRIERRFRSAQIIDAVRNVTLEVFPGEVVGLVGESGSGKSTVGRLIMGLEKTDGGSISMAGQEIVVGNSRQMRRVRRDMQIVFQDPKASLNPHMRIETIIGEPLVIHGAAGSRQEVRQNVLKMLGIVGLGEEFAKRFPAELSGGQQQRVAIARALILKPKFIVADEPITSLDVSIRAQIINLLQDLQVKYRLAILFISHDLSVVRHFCDRICVMYKGRIVESAPAMALFAKPTHPYTQALLSAIPIPDPDMERGRKPISIDPATIGGMESSRLIEIDPGHYVAEHY